MILTPDERPRRLRLASEPGPGMEVRRAAMAETLARLADIAGSGDAWALGDHECQPIAALIVTTFTETGEPVFVPVGVEDAWNDQATWDEVRADIEQGLWRLRRGGLSAVRTGWIKVDNHRRREAFQRRVKDEQLARTHPYLCVCGRRCKTPGGFSRHQRSCFEAKRATRET